MEETLSEVDGLQKVLMLVYVFPPFFSVGGSIRAVKFIKYLPNLGWLPVVLTIDDKKEYDSMRKEGSEYLLSEIPPQVKVFRTTAGEPSLKFLEEERKFSRRNWLTGLAAKIFGAGRRWAYRTLLLPDQYLAWFPFALRQGLKIVRAEKIDAIFATCPPDSVSLIGAFLKILARKPLILDFRDDWIDTPEYYITPKPIRIIRHWIERWVVNKADKVILVTERSLSAFVARYSKEPLDKFIFIPNGCDLDEFDISDQETEQFSDSKFTIMHAGLLQDSNSWVRSPVSVFQAVSSMLQHQPEMTEKLVLAFTGQIPGSYRKLADEMGLSSIVKEFGYLQRQDFIRQMKSSDLLLAINYQGFTTLIPGKLYEYWAVGGPPILLLDHPGAAQSLIEKFSLGFVRQPDDVKGIADAILELYKKHQSGNPLRISSEGIERFNRKTLAKNLAQILSIVVGL